MTKDVHILLAFLTALFASLFVMPKLSYIANRIGLIDQPNARKIHSTPRPLVGGLGIVISATFSCLVFMPLEGMRGFFSGLALLLLVGFFDDYMEVGHRKKFLAQILATALLIYLSKVQLSNFGDLLGLGDLIVPPPIFLVWCVTVFCVVGVTNAVNMIDGLDGLAGGLAFLAFLSFAIISSMSSNTTLMLLNLAFCGAILGFLKYNWSPSVLFMGDSGSLCLGFALSFMAIALTQYEGADVPPVSMLLVLAVPISDTLGVMTKRLVKHSSPFKPDKTHLHHILMAIGLSQNVTVVLILLLSACFCSLGIAAIFYNIPEPALFIIFLCYFLVNYKLDLILGGLVSLAGPFGSKQDSAPKTTDHSILQGTGRWKVFRNAHPYTADLSIRVRCKIPGPEFSGRILNVSENGFLAQINDLVALEQTFLIDIMLTNGTVQSNRTFVAEQLWMSESKGGYYHGFRFVDMSPQLLSEWKSYLELIRQNGNNELFSLYAE